MRRDHPRFRTQWCEFYNRSHGCRFGDNCNHAHTWYDYRGQHPTWAAPLAAPPFAAPGLAAPALAAPAVAAPALAAPAWTAPWLALTWGPQPQGWEQTGDGASDDTTAGSSASDPAPWLGMPGPLRVHLPEAEVEIAESDSSTDIELEMMYDGDWAAHPAPDLVLEPAPEPVAHPAPELVLEPAPEPVTEADAAAGLPGENILAGQFIEADPGLAQLTEDEILNIQNVNGEMVTSAAAADIEEDSLQRLTLTRSLNLESIAEPDIEDDSLQKLIDEGDSLLGNYGGGPDPHGGDGASSDDSWLRAHGSYI